MFVKRLLRSSTLLYQTLFESQEIWQYRVFPPVTGETLHVELV